MSERRTSPTPQRFSKLAMTIASGVTLAIVASGCGGTVTRRAGDNDPSGPDLAQLAALPSKSPASADLASGGGGLSGGVWTVFGMPGALSGNDAGLPVQAVQQSTSGGVRTKLTALTGQGPYQWVVRDSSDPNAATKPPMFDSGSVSAASPGNCTVNANEASCTVPPGVLAVGGQYSVATTANGATETRLFTVTDQPAASGSVDAEIPSQQIVTGFGQFGLGLKFNTASLGVTHATATKGGFTQGLPPGWAWSGFPGSLASVTTATTGTGGYQGYGETVTLHMGAGTMQLGCTANSNGSTCNPLTGPTMGSGYVGTISKDGKTVTITDQASLSSWNFDEQGRLTQYQEPGQYPLTITYRGSSNSFDRVEFGPLDWQFAYNGDRACDDGDLPAGFVETPADYVCAISMPTRDWNQFLYTKPQGADVPRISRMMRIPDSCSSWRDCPPSNVEVMDIGWNESNRPYLQRNEASTWGVLYGSLSTGYDGTQTPSDQQAAADPTLLMAQYDPQGRIGTVTMPTRSAFTSPGGAPRQVATRTYAEYGQIAATLKQQGLSYDFSPSTRLVEMTQSISDNSIPATTSLKTFDDATRGIYSVGPDGAEMAVVWHPTVLNMQLATVASDGVQSNSYDNRGRQINSYTGPASSFNLTTCSPDASASTLVSGTACLPTNAAQVVSQTLTYDQINNGSTTQGHVGTGLTQLYYDNPTFSGLPQSMTKADWQTPSGQAPGFAMNPPSEVGTDFGLRLTGGLSLPQKNWAIQVALADHQTSGTLTIDGQAPCPISNGVGSCTFNNNAGGSVSTASAVQFVLNLTRTSSDPVTTGNIGLVFTDQSAGRRVVVATTNFTERYNSVTQQSTTDPLLASSSKSLSKSAKKAMLHVRKLELAPSKAGAQTTSAAGNSTNAFFNYDDVTANSPTSITGQGTSTAGVSTNAPASISQFEPAANFNVRLEGERSPDNQMNYAYQYYGDSDTPAGSGMSNMDDVPKDIQDQRQYGQRKSITDPNGRTMNMIYDEFGSLACRRYTSSDSDPNARWSCVDRDGAYRMVSRSAISSEPGQASIYVAYSYQFGTKPGDPLITSNATMTNELADKTTDTQTSVSAVDQSQQVLQYTDAIGTQTVNTYDGGGRLVKAAMTPGELNGTKYQANTTTYGYGPNGELSTVAANGLTLAKAEYAPQKPGGGPMLSSVTYFPGQKNQFSLDVVYGPTGSVSQNVWKLADQTVTDSMVGSIGGQVVASSFAGTDMAFQYDGRQRLTWASVGDMNFTYGYDDNSHRTCAAANVPNPSASSSCADLKGTTYTFTKDQMTATSDPANQIPANASDAFTRTGNYKRYGDLALTYDADQLMLGAKADNGDYLQVRRDAEARIIDQAYTIAEPADPVPLAPASPAESGEPEPTGPSAPSPVATAAETGATPTDDQAAGQGAPIADPAPTQAANVVKSQYGYGSAQTTQPSVIYTPSGPVTMYYLPGQLQLAGSNASISNSLGTASLTFDASTGKVGTAQAEYMGPFGEMIPTGAAASRKAAAAANDTAPLQPVERFTHQGARSFSRDLAIMVQPDPSVTPGDTQYGGAGPDPINNVDPSGLTRQGKSDSTPGWQQILYSMLGEVAGIFLSQYISRKWITKSNWFKAFSPEGQRATLFLFYWGMDMAISVGVAAADNHGDLKKTWSITWDIDSAIALLSGFFGAYGGQVTGQVDNILTKTNSTVDELQKQGTQAIKDLKEGAASLYAKPIEYANEAIKIGKAWMWAESTAQVAKYLTGGSELAYYGVKAIWGACESAAVQGMAKKAWKGVQNLAGSVKKWYLRDNYTDRLAYLEATNQAGSPEWFKYKARLESLNPVVHASGGAFDQFEAVDWDINL